MCNYKSYIELCDKYQIVKSDLNNKVNIQKERMFIISLRKDSTITASYQKPLRSKQGIIYLIGSVVYKYYSVFKAINV